MENENIEQIKQKLEFMNINRIISIDNEWLQNSNIDLNKDITDFIEEMHPENEKELLRRISNKGYLTLKDAFDDEDNELIKLINSKKVIQNQLSPNLAKLDEVLKNLQSKGIVIERINDYQSSIFKKYNTENCLFILDKEMDEGTHKDIIKESIPNIIEESNNNGLNHLIIVYSSNISDEYLNNSKKLEYVKQRIQHPSNSRFYIYKMFAIEKKPDTKLDEELNKKISECIYGDALYHYMILEKDKTDKIYDSICEIENEEISKISEENFIEGNNISDSINTIKSALEKIQQNAQFDKEKIILEKFIFYQKDKIKNFISNNTNLTTNSQYSKYRESKNIDFVDNILGSDLSVWENVDYSINKFYRDISTGDIFKIKLLQENKEQYLMIIENACDCIIRNQKNIDDISRKNANIKVLLLEKCTLSESEKKKIVNQFSNGEIIFPIKDDSIFYLKNTGKTYLIPQIVLDLCTLNENGKCLINYDKNVIHKYKNYYFESYMDMPETLKNIEHIKTYLAAENAIEKAQSKLETESNTKIIHPFEIDIDKSETGGLYLKRIGRLDYNSTLRICQKNYYDLENKLLSGDNDKLSKLVEQRKNTRTPINKIIAIKK